jgi:hypothetical protein
MVINHSGGKDSMRILGLVREEFPELPMISVMADTGFEHEFPDLRGSLGVSASDLCEIRCRSRWSSIGSGSIWRWSSNAYPFWHAPAAAATPWFLQLFSADRSAIYCGDCVEVIVHAK